MKLKEKFQRFWTLSGSRQGFTLVELIVVIAILAILAGVAIPVYNGYIKKAQTAADQTLLDSVNTSFVAACVENGFSQYDVKYANLPINDDGTLGELTSVKFADGKYASAEIYDSFDFYFAGNENAAFNTFKGALVFDPATAMFVEDVGVAIDYNGTTLYVPQSTITALQNSTYSDIGAANLLGEISSLVDLVGGEDMDVSGLLEDETYMRRVATYMGIENADTLSFEQLDTALTAAIDKIPEEKRDDVMVNGLVFYAAENSSTMTPESVTTMLNSGNIRDVMSDDTATMLSQASMVYGMYTGYVNSDYYKGEAADVKTDPIDIVKTVGSDEEFVKYVNSAKGQADIEAYIAAMGVLSDSTTDSEVTSNVLQNGYSDAELIAMLQGVLGG